MRVRTRLAFFLILLSTFALGQTTNSPGTVTAAIRGRVTDDLTHEGVSTARVTLTGGALRDSVVVTTDGQGNVLFPGLAPSRYSLAIDKAGYSRIAARIPVDG